jgi:hypothetical protein
LAKDVVNLKKEAKNLIQHPESSCCSFQNSYHLTHLNIINKVDEKDMVRIPVLKKLE